MRSLPSPRRITLLAALTLGVAGAWIAGCGDDDPPRIYLGPVDAAAEYVRLGPPVTDGGAE